MAYILSDTPVTEFTTVGATLSTQIAAFLPRLLLAILVLIIGYIIASALARLVKRAVGYTKVDHTMSQLPFMQKLSQSNIRFNISDILAKVVKWFILIVTFITVSDTLGVPQITRFFEAIALYIPNVLIAIVILTIGMWVGSIIDRLVTQALSASSLPKTSIGVLGGIAKWSIIVFSFLAALVQLQVASSLIQIFFTGLVAMFALAGGLAFGLGGRNAAAQWLESMQQNITQQRKT